MAGVRIPLPQALLLLLAQACAPNNVPFLPNYEVDVDVVDTDAQAADNTVKGTFNRGHVKAVAIKGGCSVQLQLGQCKNAEQVWVVLKAQPSVPGGTTCTPTAYQRLKEHAGGTVPLVASPEQARQSGLWVELWAGSQDDSNNNGRVDRHTTENRIATRPLTVGSLAVHKLTDSGGVGADGVTYTGELLMDVDAFTPGVGSVKGRVDGLFNPGDGFPVGPRCTWPSPFTQTD